ncbi:GNAT family N-acetyltransferase [Cohaesibacter celericrescens]|uniref:N-acetyltransferase domain-containing protein n=1 Tax=Cohaesibacter celericrescens TaxID=2067669 RepID=A0A2N5XQN7_9HYPH|nr:GNAT family N-acetyltransferase [Cohaesibacter celericrescens]PLW76757.1 hypothetical protein C0081_11865 [Cohaesibacter celericrescens]
MTAVLRPITAHDLNAATLCGVAAWVSTIAPLLDKFEASDLSKIEQTFQYFFLAHLMKRDNDQDHLIVAELDGQIAGFYNLDSVTAELTDLWVPQQWQGQGTAGLMLRDAMATAREFGHANLTLEVQVGNVRAIAFYHKHDFVECGRKVERDPILECMVEKIQMRLPLAYRPVSGIVSL